MTGQTDEQGGRGRQIFMTQQEKPVAIFLPQHRPGRAGGPSKPVMAAVMATVVILGGSLFFLMPRGDIGVAEVATVGADAAGHTRADSMDMEKGGDKVAAIVPDEPSSEMASATQSASSIASVVAVSAPAAKAPRTADIPRKDDPRWARVETKQGSAALEAVRELIVEKAGQVDEEGSALLAYAGSDPSASGFAGAAAETRRPMQIVFPAELPEQPDASSRTASVNAAVNLRKGPGAKHGVMMVIPRKAKVEIFDCDQWCKVGYEGRTGYIYKSFVGGRSS